MKFSIREMVIEDYDDVLKLWREAKLEYKPNGRDRKENIIAQLAMDNTTYLLAINDGKIIGSIFATHDGRKGWINRLAVHPDFRHHGIAKSLISEAEKILHSQGMDYICSLIEDYNNPSMSLFEKIGYTKMKQVLYYGKKKHKDA